MELKKTTIKGREIYVMFTGNEYFFYSNYYGLLAVAERYNDTHFITAVGNHHTIGGQMNTPTIERAVKRYINREENQFVTKKVSFEFFNRDLANSTLKVECI